MVKMKIRVKGNHSLKPFTLSRRRELYWDPECNPDVVSYATAAEIIPPSFCHIKFFHGNSHLPIGSRNDCMHDWSRWVKHQSGWLEIYS